MLFWRLMFDATDAIIDGTFEHRPFRHSPTIASLRHSIDRIGEEWDPELAHAAADRARGRFLFSLGLTGWIFLHVLLRVRS